MKMDKRDYAQMYAEWIMNSLEEDKYLYGMSDEKYFSIQNKIEDFLNDVILREVM